MAIKPASSRANIFPKGPYEGRNQSNNAKRLAAPLASTLAARSPVGRINNIVDPTVDNPTAGPVRGFLQLGVSVVAGTPTTFLVQMPNAKQLLLTEVIGQALANDACEGLLFLQFFLNNSPASALMNVGVTKTLSAAVASTVNGTAGPFAASLGQARVSTFTPIGNVLYNLDFDSVNFLNYSLVNAYSLMGLWASGSARIFPLPAIGN
jgi:hypothetical protein